MCASVWFLSSLCFALSLYGIIPVCSIRFPIFLPLAFSRRFSCASRLVSSFLILAATRLQREERNTERFLKRSGSSKARDTPQRLARLKSQLPLCLLPVFIRRLPRFSRLYSPLRHI